ncbi:hypothetical protein O6H91_08G061300 [Diphasiastrum complanatum]|nr:hypothetical protein O6H91_08G061300 [Diphasiastrum complanatum]
MMAFRLAVLEKVATGLGVMAFVWATVVLLGGHVELLENADFRIVTTIIFTEGARVFSRSHELEWQHAASRSLLLHESTKPKKTSMEQEFFSDSLPHADTEAQSQGEQTFTSLEDPSLDELKCCGPFQGKSCNNGSGSVCFPFEIQRTWTFSAVPFISNSNLFLARHVSSMLYYLQLISAAVSLGLSITQISSQKFTRHENQADNSKLKNLPLALNVFYALALLQSLVFLVERSYWEYKIRYKEVLHKVQTSCKLNEFCGSLEMVKDFFYEVYSTSLKKSIFDGLAMDLVGYSITEIQSNSAKQQLGGMHVLLALVNQKDLEAHTLRRIGTTRNAINRLLEMLTWKNQHEKQIRLAAASILERFVRYSGNRFKVIAVSGALEAISSLLTPEEDYCPNEQNVLPLFSNELRLLGLRILKDLTEVHNNRFRIGSIRGLMRILVTLIKVRRGVLESRHAYEFENFTISLLLIKLLVTTTGKSGHILRDQIGRTVFLLKNLRDILGCTGLMSLKKLALDIVISLALDNHQREGIGRTGGMITNLLKLFLTRVETQQDESDVDGQELFQVRSKAGEALNLIVLQNRKNCRRLMDINHFSSSSLTSNLEILDKLKELLMLAGQTSTNMKQRYCEHPELGAFAANMLQRLFAYLTADEKDVIVSLTPGLIEMSVKLMENSTIAYQEAVLGLAASIVPSLPRTQNESVFFSQKFKRSFRNEFRNMLEGLSNFQLDFYPQIRRHIVELAIALMRHDNFYRQELRQVILTDEENFEDCLRNMLQSVSEVENYCACTISGQMGLTRYPQTMEHLIKAAIKELHCQVAN